ncbi:MAG: diguanylate cyclase [Gallionella sp.]|nr:diguanylate cyclase [Gallionella sp.]
MTTQRIQGHPVLIIGAGRGGHALLEMFLEDNLVQVIAIADTNPDAQGIQLAKKNGIPAFDHAADALLACRHHPDCIVYNLSHNDAIADEVDKIFPGKRVASGPEVKLFWQMIMNLKQTKGELEKSQSQLQAIIHNVMDGIITINEAGEIQGFNPAAEQIFGYLQQEVSGENVKILMPEPAKSEHDDHINRYLCTGLSGLLGVRGREVTAVRKNGEQFPMELSVSKMVLGAQNYFVGIVRDITERKLAEHKIAHLAHYDYLTDLPNRALFLDKLAHSLALARRNRYKVAVLFLDLDGFKKINDTLGHDAGDLLLQEVADRLKKTIRASDTVARVGGDEFTFVLNDADGHAAIVANKIISTLSEPFDLKGQICHVGGSIGISIFPDDAQPLETLIAQADAAMYLAKQSGKNTFKFHQDVVRLTP